VEDIESPADLADRLVELFPALAREFDVETVESYHQVILLVSHRFAELLRVSPGRVTRDFCALINAMVAKGGDQANAVSTCLLEHASHVRIRSAISPFLTPAAKSELR
jgi:hypothetical protein